MRACLVCWFYNLLRLYQISKVQVSTSNTDCCSTDIGTDSIATVTEHSPVHSSEIVNSIDQESDRTINNSVEREKEPTLKVCVKSNGAIFDVSLNPRFNFNGASFRAIITHVYLLPLNWHIAL